VKRDPANTSDHLVLQQMKVMVVHLQIFLRRVKPIPCFDQSVARQVTFPSLNVLTPQHWQMSWLTWW
jgi:hypothetical protein